jgi:hypothetical protein
MSLRHVSFFIVCFAATAGCGNDASNNNAAQAKASIATGSELTGRYTYECRFWSKGRDGTTFRFVRAPSIKPALEEDEWQVSSPRGSTNAKKSEWGASEGGSFALTWTEPDGRIAKAYLSFGDIPDKNGAQPLSVEIEYDGLGKMKFNQCGVPPLEDAGVDG